MLPSMGMNLVKKTNFSRTILAIKANNFNVSIILNKHTLIMGTYTYHLA